MTALCEPAFQRVAWDSQPAGLSAYLGIRRRRLHKERRNNEWHEIVRFDGTIEASLSRAVA